MSNSKEREMVEGVAGRENKEEEKSGQRVL